MEYVACAVAPTWWPCGGAQSIVEKHSRKGRDVHHKLSDATQTVQTPMQRLYASVLVTGRPASKA